MAAARLYLHLLGLFRLLQSDQPLTGFGQAHLQHLLAHFVLHRAAPMSRQQLAFLFWPDSIDQQALKNLRTLLSRLRHIALPDADHFIDVTAQTIQWGSDTPSIPARHDVWRRASANWLAGLAVRGLIDMADAAEMAPDMANGLARRAYKL